MGELLSHRLNESKIATHRRAFENDVKSDNLEAMENWKEKRMGITQTRSTKMDCTQSGKLGRPLSICGNKIRFGKSNFKRNTDQARLNQYFGLLPKGSTYLILN